MHGAAARTPERDEARLFRPAFVILVTEDERTCCECSGDHHEHGDYDESAAHTGGDATGSPHDRVRHHAGQPRAAIYVLDD
jgi:hypothetical protein